MSRSVSREDVAESPRNIPRTEKGLQTFVMNLRPTRSREWLALGGGLTLCVEPSGAKTFQARLRRLGEPNARRVRIGSFPALSVVDARRKLSELKALAREGRDPALEQRRKRAGVKTVRTLNELISEYMGRRRGMLAAKTLKNECELLEGILGPVLGDRLLADLAPLDFGTLIASYAKKLRREGRSQGTNANKLLAAARRMFKAARGWGLIELADPTAALMRPAKERPRDRVLFDGHLLRGPDASSNELGLLVQSLKEGDRHVQAAKPARIAILLTLIMGFRALEVCGLEWSALNLESPDPAVTVTRSKTKAGLRTLPLPRLAVELLCDLRKTSALRGTYVFPAERRSRRAVHMHPESLSRAFTRTCGPDHLNIERVTLHDLRRTCLTGLIELGHEEVAGRIAGHSPRHVLGRHYDRSTRLEPMRAALEAWAGALEQAAARSRQSAAENFDVG